MRITFFPLLQTRKNDLLAFRYFLGPLCIPALVYGDAMTIDSSGARF